MDERLTKKSDGWYRGCGCGMRPTDKVIPPSPSVELTVNFNGPLKGPRTGIEYHFVPQTVSIDIAPEDAAAWRVEGKGRDPVSGWKGRLARVETQTTV